MAELITTDEEKAAASYLDWDDAALGKAAKKLALSIANISADADDLHKVATFSAGMLLIGAAIENNAGDLRLDVDGFSHKDQSCGDWEIVVRKKGAAPADDYFDLENSLRKDGSSWAQDLFDKAANAIASLRSRAFTAETRTKELTDKRNRTEVEVHVVMGNDYPAAVFYDKAEAETYCVMQRAESIERLKQQYGPKYDGPGVYYRVYSFELQGAKPADDLLAEADKALKHFAEKFLYPDDYGEEMAAHTRADEDWNEASNDAVTDDIFIKRGAIRRAREVRAKIAAAKEGK